MSDINTTYPLSLYYRLLPNLGITEGGKGWSIEFGPQIEELDAGNGFAASLGFTSISTGGHHLPDTSFSGTSTENKYSGFRLTGSFYKRSILKKPTFAWRSENYSSFFTGSVTRGSTGGRTLDDDFEVAGDSDSLEFYGVETGKRWGLELRLSPEFYIMPMIGYATSIRQFDASNKKLEEFPYSTRHIQLMIGLRAAFGKTGSKITEHEDYNNYDFANYLFEDITNIISDYFLFQNFDQHVSGAEGLSSDIMGEGSINEGYLWFVPSLQSLSLALMHSRVQRPISFYLKGWSTYSQTAEAVKGISYLLAAASRDDSISDNANAPLLTNAFIAANNFAIMAANKRGIREKHLPIFAFALSGIEMLFPGLLTDSALSKAGLAAGTVTATAFASSPEQGKVDFIEQTTYSLSPTYVYDNLEAWTGGLFVRNQFKDSSLYMEMGLLSPLINPINLGNFGVNQVRDPANQSAYRHPTSHNMLLATLGTEWISDNLRASLGLTLVNDNLTRGTVGVSGDLYLYLTHLESIGSRLGVGAKAMLYLTGATISPSIIISR